MPLVSPQPPAPGPRSSPCPLSRDTARPSFKSFKSSVAPDPSPLTPPPPPALAQTCGLERPAGLASRPLSKGSVCQDQSTPLHTLGLTPGEILLLRVQLKRHHFHDALPDHPLQPPLLSESSEARRRQITDHPAQPPQPPHPLLGRKGGGTRAEADRCGAGRTTARPRLRTGPPNSAPETPQAPGRARQGLRAGLEGRAGRDGGKARPWPPAGRW